MARTSDIEAVAAFECYVGRSRYNRCRGVAAVDRYRKHFLATVGIGNRYGISAGCQVCQVLRGCAAGPRIRISGSAAAHAKVDRAVRTAATAYMCRDCTQHQFARSRNCLCV